MIEVEPSETVRDVSMLLRPNDPTPPTTQCGANIFLPAGARGQGQDRPREGRVRCRAHEGHLLWCVLAPTMVELFDGRELTHCRQDSSG